MTKPSETGETSRGIETDADRVSADMTNTQNSTELFERYVIPEIEVLLRVGRSLTGNTADAEDLVQDTLIRAFRSIDRFDGQHPRAWLLTILRNTHINRNRRQRPELLRDPDGTQRHLADGPGTEQTDAMVDALFDAEVEAALRHLDKPFRRVVELVEIEGLSYAEAAGILGIPTGTVMSRLHRARGRIRDRLDRAGIAPRSM